MQLQKNVSLKSYNTFGIDVSAEYFVSVESIAILKEALQLDVSDTFVLGGGSNLLLTKNVKGLVIHNAIKGISIVEEDRGTGEILVRVNAGENWHKFVLYCIKQDWGGIENMSLIPGNVGTAPIQNIGAYGVELKDVFHSCIVLDRKSLEEKTFKLEDCHFDYRDSIFKQEAKDQYVITSVTFKLTTKDHKLKTTYGAIHDTLMAHGIHKPSIADVSEAVIAIRKSKLPDPDEIGNSGSFFKNPIVDKATFKKLRTLYSDIPYYPVGNNTIKIPAGWLIEKAGFKGKRYGDAGIHEKQALVLVNYGNAQGSEIWEVAMQIQKTIQEKFGLTLNPEINVL